MFNPYSAGISFRRQNPTSKVDPRTVRVKMFIMAVYQLHYTRMIRKEPTKTFIMIFKLEKPFGLHKKIFQRFKN